MATIASMAASRTFFFYHQNPKLVFRKNPISLAQFRSVKSTRKALNTLNSLNQDPVHVHRRNAIDILQERGLIESITHENLRLACSNPNPNSNFSPVKVYCGFDPTAESLHLGNLIGIIVLSWFQRCGFKTVALIGGATAQIGDPSGKSLERPELDVRTVEKNSLGIENIVSRIFGRVGKNLEQNPILNVGFENIVISDNTGPVKSEISDSDAKKNAGFGKDAILDMGFGKNVIPNIAGGKYANLDAGFEKNANSDVDFGESFIILNNYDWWKDISFLSFQRDVGKFARVGTMIAKESVKKRLMSEEGMSFTEFSYQLMQAYDFLYMFKEMDVNVQIGGSDQWGNITAGTELIRKKLQVEGAYGLTFPLLLKSDGTKFGKSEEGAIWLSPSMLSPYKFYQYFFSVPDVDVVRFLKILTFLRLEEINELEKGMKMPDYVPNSVQRRLAEEVTRFVHGEEGLLEALKATEALRPGAETQLNWETIEGIAEDVPSFSLSYVSVLNSSIVDLSVSTGLLGSKSAARRMLKQGGLYLNNRRVDSEEKTIEEGDIVDGKVLLLAAGKKNKMETQWCLLCTRRRLCTDSLIQKPWAIAIC